jgi:ketosteroid isomerase-like protein
MSAHEDVAALREIARQAAAGFNSGDLDQVMRHYGSRYVDINLRNPVQTHAERRAYFQSVLRRRKLRIEVDPDEILVEGTLAFVRGRIDLFDLNDGTKNELRYVEVARKTADGWKMIWGMDGPVQEYTQAEDPLPQIGKLVDVAEYLGTALESIPADIGRRRPKGGGFSLVEHACHLRDYEVMGVQERIDKMLREERPTFTPFPGDRLAVERDYLNQDMVAGLDGFRLERLRTADRLRKLNHAEWQRVAEFGEEGTITIARLVEIVAEHDASHRREIEELLHEIGD